MKLLVPIVPKGSAGPLRVIPVVRSSVGPPLRRRGNSLQFVESVASTMRSNYEQTAGLARSYLDIIYAGCVRTVMICNTAAAADSGSSLERAMDLIAAGEVDLIITCDLKRFSRHPVEVMEFLQFCQQNETRVIAFENHLDTGDNDWESDGLFESLRSLLDTSESE